MKKLLCVSLLTVTLGATSASAATYSIDPDHTEVSFRVKHLGLSNVRGNFRDFSGTIEFDPEKIGESSASASINTQSVDTANKKRDDHLRSADFFNVNQHPKMSFVSKEVQEVNGNSFKVLGDLTINGVTKPVTLDVQHLGNAIDPWGNQKAGFQASTLINRKDFGLGWNKVLEAGGVLVGEEVHIDIALQATKEKASE